MTKPQLQGSDSGDRSGRLYWLLARLLEQMDWERHCEEQGWEPSPLTWEHRDIEKKARDEIAGTVQWWEHAEPKQAHRLIGSREPEVIERRWSHKPERLAPDSNSREGRSNG